MMGIGSMSCAHWRSTQAHLLEGIVWIYGFWTGLNYVAAASDQAQAKIDMATIVVQVEKTCAQQTLQTLGSAVSPEPQVAGAHMEPKSHVEYARSDWQRVVSGLFMTRA